MDTFLVQSRQLRYDISLISLNITVHRVCTVGRLSWYEMHRLVDASDEKVLSGIPQMLLLQQESISHQVSG